MSGRYWEDKPLEALDRAQWESLCDGCGKCCLNKIEYEDTGEVEYTRVACRLLDNETCRCSNDARRFEFVPECIRLNPKTLKKISYWLPATCAYKLLQQGKPLPDWHPLVTGDPDSTHSAGQSMRGQTVSEAAVDENDWDDYIIQEEL